MRVSIFPQPMCLALATIKGKQMCATFVLYKLSPINCQRFFSTSIPESNDCGNIVSVCLSVLGCLCVCLSVFTSACKLYPLSKLGTVFIFGAHYPVGQAVSTTLINFEELETMTVWIRIFILLKCTCRAYVFRIMLNHITRVNI